MIDIDTIIQNIEDKIHILEKLKFDDDPKNFLYTPITAVTITSSTDFKQLECQKFVRCARSNKLVPLGKFSDTVEALKDENSENLSNGNGKEAKIGARITGDASVQQKRNYRRNSIAYFDQKVPLEEKTTIAGKKRRNSTKFDIQKPSEVINIKNPMENGQKKPKVTPGTTKPFTAQTSSPLVTPRPSLSAQLSKNPPLTKLDQQYTLKKPTHQAQTTTAPPAGSPKFSRSYTEFLSNLNKDMKKFKEQQMRNEPCDNFLGKDAKMFVEDPIAKHLGDVKDTKVGVADRNVDAVKSNGNKDEVAKKIDPKLVTKAKIDNKTATIAKNDPKPVIAAKIDAASTNRTDSILKIPDSPPKTPIYGLKYLVKAPKPQPEPSKNIFGKIIKNPTENAPKLLNKIVMRRMTIDSSWDHRSLLRMKSDASASESSPKVQKIQLPQSSPTKANLINIEKSPEKLQKIPAVNQDLIHQKIIRLSPQKPQNSNDESKPEKLTKPQQNIIKSLKQKIPRRNSIGYGVRIETANDIKRLKLSQDVRRSLGDLEAIKKVQELANGSTELKKRGRKPSKNIQNSGTTGKIDKKVSEAAVAKNVIQKKKESLKSTEKSSVFSNIIKNAVLNTPINSIDFEDELENISACHIDKLAPTKSTNDDKTTNSKTDVIIEDVSLQSTKSVSSKREKISNSNKKIKSIKSVLTADIKEPDTKAENIITTESIQIKKRGRPSKKLKIDDNKVNEIKVEDVDMKLSDTYQKNNNLEQVEKEKNEVNLLTDTKDTEDKTKSKEVLINNKVQSQEVPSNHKVESTRVLMDKKIPLKEDPISNKSESNGDVEKSKIQPKKGNKDSLDVVTSKTLDIFRDIENYRNLIRQQSSDSQNSNKTVESGTRTEETATNSQEKYKKKQKIRIDSKSLVKIDDKVQKPKEESQLEQDLKIEKKSELVEQDIKIEPQNTESRSKNVVQKQKSVDVSYPISSQPSQNLQSLTQSLQSSQLSSQSTKTRKNSSQSSQNSQDLSQISQLSQNSITATPTMSQSPQLSDSQTTSTPDQTLGKRRRQINPKYKESEYLLKNTSREFTNAIRSKMMVNKPQKTSGRKQSTKPEEQNPEKSGENLETSKSVEVASTSTSPARPASSEIKCEICGKTFIKPQGLTRHMPLHSTDRRYKCSKCDYRFKQSSDLMRHMLLHEGSPTIPCPQCDKKFRTAKNLQAHLETHEDTLPYKCDQCEIRFRSSKNLRYHLMSHHSGVKFQCGYCGNKFSDEKSLRTHVMQHETEDEDLDDEELEDYLDFMDEEEEELEDSDDEPMVIAE